MPIAGCYPAGMTIKLNHTIVYCHDKRASSTFLTDLFGRPEAVPFGPFLGVEVGNEVTLDFYDDEGAGSPQHYAFLVGEDEFDQIFGRIQARGLAYWADPGHSLPGEINTHDGGRGVYFDDPSGHILEIITRPYGEPR
jgi:catechol 2,3-dioxygenase-like lactoylglutathione lyase family enzyme